MALVRKVPLKKFDPPSRHSMALLLLDIYGHQSRAQLWRDTHHFWHLQRGLHQGERRGERNGILVGYHWNIILVLLKTMLSFISAYSTRWESSGKYGMRQSRVLYLSWDSHFCIYHTNEAAVLCGLLYFSLILLYVLTTYTSLIH